MKAINSYLSEALNEGRSDWDPDAKLAPENVQAHLGLKYSDGAGGGDNEEFLNISVGGKGNSRVAIERGKIEGQDKVFALIWSGTLDKDDVIVAVAQASRPMAKKLDVVAFYYLDEHDAKSSVRMWPGVQHIVCKDLDSLVENIRNDYGKVRSYNGKGHKEEKDGVIYTY